ncbi:inositol hexakisphosphate kinase 3-like [Lytechinus pictus]|uniref:inositol hexakisphosphate kinase 3-like n=1 Tax=Lytechinus pictus TaxID=7653 RepID=UPI0030B9D546
MALPEGGVLLTPFIHQVGGHRGILLYDSRSICKPMFEREIQNYRYLAPIMGHFIPKFKGIVEVVIEKDKDGKVEYRAVTAPSFDLKCKRSTNIQLSSVNSTCNVTDARNRGNDVNNLKRNVAQRYNGHCLQNNNKNSSCERISSNHQCLDDSNEATKGKVFEDVTEYSYQTRGNGLNPWSLWVHQLDLQKLNMGENRPFNTRQDYMLLENVTVDYQCPSIIDLKIGTRCYGDDLSEEKKQLNIARALDSTTNKLGVRFGGMQIYQADKGTYVCCNKKYGNKLTEEDLRYEVGRFVYDKHRHSKKIRAWIIQRITQLKDLISSLNQYRFFGCSVLIIYEGMQKVRKGGSRTVENDRQDPGKVEVLKEMEGSGDVEWTPREGDGKDRGIRVVNDHSGDDNTGKATKEAEGSGNVDSSRDIQGSGDVVFSREGDGKDRGIRLENDHGSDGINVKDAREVKGSGNVNSYSSRDVQGSGDIEGTEEVDGSRNGDGKLRLVENDSDDDDDYDEGNVLVKIIDFAHSSSVEVAGMDGIHYEGVDRGFLYGLETLVELIRKVPLKT